MVLMNIWIITVIYNKPTTSVANENAYYIVLDKFLSQLSKWYINHNCCKLIIIVVIPNGWKKPGLGLEP